MAGILVCGGRYVGPALHNIGNAPVVFLDVLPKWVLRAQTTAKIGRERLDMSFRQIVHYTAQFAVKIVPSLMLNMTSQELPHPNPNGYQQIIKWCICGAKGFVLVVLRPANGSRAGGVDRFDDQKPRFIRAHNRSNHQPSGTCRRTLGFRSRSQSCGPLVQL